METPARYPLQWPSGWRRAPYRRNGKFTKEGRPINVADASRRLERELERLGAERPVLSTNVELRMDGRPRSDQNPGDPGAAVYFAYAGKATVFACDTYHAVADNIAAIAAHCEALRAIDRYGVGNIEQALAGYRALPASAGSWFIVLEFNDPPKVWAVVEARYKSLARVHHPDVAGGNTETMAKINAAYDTARQEFGK